ncbi:MAG: hypothetical protein GY950_31105 [bacterium]|nr:hypothetical protein [bacterium]
MKRFALLMVVLMLLLTACGKEPKNIFHDKTLQTIYSLQNQRNTNALLPYLENEKPVYRKAAALAFASVQDPAAVQPLADLLNDPDETVRSAVAYALGQTKDKSAEPLLIKSFETEKSPKIKQTILEAVGKCGTTEGLTFITTLQPDNEKTHELTGQAMGLYRFGLQKITSPEGTARVMELLKADMPENARFFAANYLVRAGGIDLKEFAPQLLQAFEREKNLFTRMNLAAAMRKTPLPEVLERLKNLLKEKADYRIKVNAVGALRGFEYENSKESLFDCLTNTNFNISIAAAEFLQANGTAADAEAYLEKALALTHWRTRSTLLTAALKYAKENNDLKKKISDAIIHTYKNSQNNYEKANLLKALAGDPHNYSFVETETFNDTGRVVGSYGVDALGEMCVAAAGEKTLTGVFAGILQKAVESGDPAMIAQAAGVLRNPAMDFIKTVKDTAFLTTALNKCKLPEDIEAWLELKKTIGFFNGVKDGDYKLPVKNSPIDWKRVAEIARDQKVTVKTAKGDIVIRLLVNESPGSVANFLRLMEEGFYKKSIFHRVVPNFVAQDGCPRGDGWGSPPHTIGSEFGPLYYEEGSVGMASSGKDTEGSQWFITHSPTPHLDGRYTIFGKVISGMDTVHKLEVGDKF